jgi:hypothetical protein
LIVAGVALSSVAPAAAQNVPTSELAGLRIGPFYVTPAFAVPNIGIDSNILNESDTPHSDEVATLAGHVDVAAGRAGFRFATSSTVSTDVFRTYTNQNAVNHRHQIRLAVVGARVAAFGAAQYVDARERYNFEIDGRVQRYAFTANAGIEFRPSAKTTLVVQAHGADTTFDDQLDGVSLNESLHQRTHRATVEWRWHLTPLTSLVTAVEAARHRFEESPRRDADRLRVLPGIEFATFAAMTGRATVGYESFDPRTSSLPNFEGVVGAVDLTLPVGSSTRLKLVADRDLEYSYEAVQPIYDVRAVGVSLLQRAGRWEFEAGGSFRKLTYQSVAGDSPLPRRVDHGTTYRGHVRCHVSRQVLASVNSELTRRESPVHRRAYEAFRIGAALEVRLGS